MTLSSLSKDKKKVNQSGAKGGNRHEAETIEKIERRLTGGVILSEKCKELPHRHA